LVGVDGNLRGVRGLGTKAEHTPSNLWWAAGYNIIAIPLAAGVLAPWGSSSHRRSAWC
jgi:cation transport ATPase